MDGVRLSANDSPTPFVVARRIHIDVPWTAVFGSTTAASHRVDGPVVTIVRGSSGTSNLPASSGTADGPGVTRLPIERLQVSRASVTYEDEANGVRAAASGVNLHAQPNGARDDRRTAHRQRSRDHRCGPATSLRRARSTALVAYDGQSIAVTALRLALPPGRLMLDGRVGIFGAPDVQLSLTGMWGLEEASALLQVEPPATGLVSFSGTVDGSMTAPAAALTITGPAVGWRDLALTGLEVRLRRRATPPCSSARPRESPAAR